MRQAVPLQTDKKRDAANRRASKRPAQQPSCISYRSEAQNLYAGAGVQFPRSSLQDVLTHSISETGFPVNINLLSDARLCTPSPRRKPEDGQRAHAARCGRVEGSLRLRRDVLEVKILRTRVGGSPRIDHRTRGAGDVGPNFNAGERHPPPPGQTHALRSENSAANRGRVSGMNDSMCRRTIGFLLIHRVRRLFLNHNIDITD